MNSPISRSFNNLIIFRPILSHSIVRIFSSTKIVALLLIGRRVTSAHKTQKEDSIHVQYVDSVVPIIAHAKIIKMKIVCQDPR